MPGKREIDAGGGCLGLLGLIAVIFVIGQCAGNGNAPPPGRSSPEASMPQAGGRLDRLKDEYPRIDPQGIRIPTLGQLKNPDFDVGGHCLAEERAGRGTFEWCIEVVGRELIAVGGPDPR